MGRVTAQQHNSSAQNCPLGINMLGNRKRVQRWCFPRSTQTTLMGPQPIYLAIWRRFEGLPHMIFFGSQKPDQSSVHFVALRRLAKRSNVSSMAQVEQKIWHNSLYNTFNLSIRFTAIKVDSYLTASVITCNEMLTNMFRYCDIHSISVQINKEVLHRVKSTFSLI